MPDFHADFGLGFMAINFPDSLFVFDVDLAPHFFVVEHEQGAMTNMTIAVDRPYTASIIIPGVSPSTVAAARREKHWLGVSLTLQDEIMTTKQGESFRPVVANTWKFN